MFIPVSECKAWAEKLKSRKDRQEALKDNEEGSWNDRFLRSNRKWSLTNKTNQGLTLSFHAYWNFCER